MIVMANDVKTKGVKLFDQLFEKAEEVIISVRGKNKYVVIDIERYKQLRALELDKAYDDTMADIEAERYKTMTADEHIEELMRELQNH